MILRVAVGALRQGRKHSRRKKRVHVQFSTQKQHNLHIFYRFSLLRHENKRILICSLDFIVHSPSNLRSANRTRTAQKNNRNYILYFIVFCWQISASAPFSFSALSDHRVHLPFVSSETKYSLLRSTLPPPMNSFNEIMIVYCLSGSSSARWVSGSRHQFRHHQNRRETKQNKN